MQLGSREVSGCSAPGYTLCGGIFSCLLGFRVPAKSLDEVLCDESEPELTMESTHEEYEGTELYYDHAQGVPGFWSILSRDRCQGSEALHGEQT